MSAEAIAVRRVHESHGSHIEPPFDDRWDDLTKLRWHAAVAEADGGVTVRVNPGGYQVQRGDEWETPPGFYSIQVGRSVCAGYRFDATWEFINGVATGAAQARLCAGGET